jgi:cellulose synthase/poly-beta-1,6-N-acetylglucosamine synthase-like glycosyltransferase
MLFVSLVFLLVNILYWVFIFRKLATFRLPANKKGNQTEVLVTICARNEASNLQRFLPAVLKQSFKQFKVIVIDDHSDDDTTDILRELKGEYKNLIIKKNEVHQGKKRSIHQTLVNEKTPIVLFTDGDCEVSSEKWISLMTNDFSENIEIVLGYGPFFKRPGYINKFARYECVMTATQYLSFALSGIPYMGVGRNLAYKKSLFDQQNGFLSHLDILSGDDDLFINQAANATNTTIQLDPGSFVYSEAPGSIMDFLRQKRRHISTSVSYKLMHQVLLSIFAISQIGFYVSLPFLGIQAICFLLLIRMIIIIPIAKQILKRLHERDLLFVYPVFDILLAVYYFVMAILGILPAQKKW